MHTNPVSVTSIDGIGGGSGIGSDVVSPSPGNDVSGIGCPESSLSPSGFWSGYSVCSTSKFNQFAKPDVVNSDVLYPKAKLPPLYNSLLYKVYHFHNYHNSN